jgi:hypothetical protein
MVSTNLRIAVPLGSVLCSLFLISLGALVGCQPDEGSYCTPRPQITGSPPTSATVGVQYVYDYTASFACGLTVCYDADPVELPDGAWIDHYTDVVFWTPTADYANKSVKFTIATPPDSCIMGGGAIARQSWTVHVSPAP